MAVHFYISCVPCMFYQQKGKTETVTYYVACNRFSAARA
jgi:hypothetical protein